jgi:WXG100 family type VII secretion target
MSSPIVIGSDEWYVDLAQFGDAITTVSGCQNSIEVSFSQIQESLNYLESYWQSPAGSTYAATQQALIGAASQLLSVLGQILGAMNTTMQNYQQAEQANASNLT